ncbi:hypothetical protein HDU67_007916 [Dinochytrium kinnereticum]|nr:hypothetical protein HDU67_007916 [Dinochytrium kinnereticum]
MANSPPFSSDPTYSEGTRPRFSEGSDLGDGKDRSSPWKIFPNSGIGRNESVGRGLSSGPSEEKSGGKRQADYNILTTKDFEYIGDHNQSNRANISQFVVGAFVEQWFCQNELPEACQEQFIQPSSFQLQCMKILVKHILQLDLRLFQTSRPKTADNSYVQLAIAAYQTLQKPLFSFLRLAIKSCKADDALNSVVEIWMAYIAPWRVDPRTSSRVPYIANNFLFYSRLLSVFMERANTIDLFAAVRPSSLILGTSSAFSGSISTSLLSKQRSSSPPSRMQFAAVERVFQLFCKAEVSNEMGGKGSLLSILQDLEGMLLSVDYPFTPANASTPGSKSRGSTGINNLTPGRRMVFDQSRGGSDLDDWNEDSASWITRYGKETLTSWIRTHMANLEARIDFEPVFRSPDESRVGKEVKKLLTNIHSTINRLKTYLPVDGRKKPEAGAIGSPTKGPRFLNERNQTVSPTSGRDSVSTIASNTYRDELRSPLSPVSPGPGESNIPSTVSSWAAQLYKNVSGMLSSSRSNPKTDESRSEVISQAMAKLCNLSELTVVLFSVSAQRKAAIIESVGGSFSETDFTEVQEYEDSATVREVAPGVFTPSLLKNNQTLSSTGRMQVKRGIRKCSPLDVPIRPSSRVHKIILSNESKWIVYMTEYLAENYGIRWLRPYVTLPSLFLLSWSILRYSHVLRLK